MNIQCSTLDTLNEPDKFLKLINNKYIRKSNSYTTINDNLDFYETSDLNKDIILPFYRINPINFNSKDIKTKLEIPNTDFILNLDFTTGQFLGILIGDGWWDHKDYYKNRRIYLADKKGFNVKYIKDYFENVLNIKDLSYRAKEELKENDESRYGDSVRHTFSFKGSTEFAKWLTFNFGGERTRYSSGAASKNINSFFIKNTSLEFKKGILNGLFSTDGSIAINNFTGKPRLNIAFTSTSKQLIEDIQQLSDSIGLNYLSNFNKLTIKGNSSYNFNPSTIDAKNMNLFDRIADLDKRDNFLNTNVKLDNIKNDNVFIPKVIQKSFRELLHKPFNEELNKEVLVLVSSLEKSKQTNLISRAIAFRLLKIEEKLNKDRENIFEQAKAFIKNSEGLVLNTSITSLFNLAFNSSYPDYLEDIKEQRKLLKNKLRAFFNRNKNKVITKKYIDYLLDFLENNYPYKSNNLSNPLIIKWRNLIVENNNLIWSKIDE